MSVYTIVRKKGWHGGPEPFFSTYEAARTSLETCADDSAYVDAVIEEYDVYDEPRQRVTIWKVHSEETNPITIGSWKVWDYELTEQNSQSPQEALNRFLTQRSTPRSDSTTGRTRSTPPNSTDALLKSQQPRSGGGEDDRKADAE